MRKPENEIVLNERFRELLEVLPDGHLVVAKDGQIVCASTRVEGLFGYAQGDLAGEPVERLLPEPFRESHREHRTGYFSHPRARAMGTGLDLRGRRKDGSDFPVDISLSPIATAEGLRVLAAVRDMTAQRQTQQAVALAEARFRDLYENAPTMLASLDPIGATIVDCNQAFANALGYAKDELIGRPVFDLYSPGFLDAAAEVLRSFQRSGEVNDAELQVRRKDGTALEVELNATAVRGRDGEILHSRSTWTDITERKRTEETLRASEEKYRSFFEEDLAGNYVSTPEGRLLDCNSSFAGIAGFDSVAAAMQSTLWSLYPSREGRESFLEMLRKHGRLQNHEHELRRRDGSLRRVIENAVGRFDEQGELVEIHGFLIDDTERRKAEEQLRQAQKIEAIGQLAGGVAHDFNNLLGVIIGYSDLLRKDLGHAHPGQARLEQIRKAADRAAGLTRQLLAFSRKQVLEPQVLDLNAVVSDVEKMLRRLIGEHIQLVSELGQDLGRAKVDPGQLEQVIVNLAVNARDAMPGGGRLIIETDNVDLDDSYARTHPGARPGPQVMLAVSDTGRGMDAETLSHVFEPFFTTKEPGKGTGLGLATVYGIVKQSGGFIAVYSEPGRGSTFKIYLPRVEGDAAARPSRADKERAAGGSETVLLLEDEPSLRLMLRELLEEAGYTVIECAKPYEALSAGQSEVRPIHLMLTDVIMPQMTGPQVAERLQGLRPRMKVLYMSGYTDDAIAQHGVLEPGTEFITKPFTRDTVLRRVRKLLDRAEA